MTSRSSPSLDHIPSDCFSIALRWLLSSCSSNTELAVLSNVCRAWRTIVTDQLLKQIYDDVPVSSLLLPCMAQELISRMKEKKYLSNGHIDSHMHDLNNSQRLQTNNVNIRSVNEKVASCLSNVNDRSVNATFCLAWFSPKGIQLDSVAISGDDSSLDSDSEENEIYTSPSRYNNRKELSPSSPKRISTESYARRVGMNMGKIQDSRKRNSLNIERKTVVKSWKGYKNPMDILLPFGYANEFVHRILKLAIGTYQPDHFPKGDMNEPKITNSNNEVRTSKLKKSTFAVRGAIEARPEGIPWDESLVLDDSIVHHLHSHYAKINESKLDSIIKNKDEIDIESRKENNEELRQELQEKRIKLQYQLDFDISRQNKNIKKIKKKMKEIKYSLPRLVLSSKEKNQRYFYAHVFPKMSKAINISSCAEKRQRSVQFLNADFSQAVRMKTLPFECGTVPMPITFFCIGIAMEDGTFVSGLRNRFELGHLYPRNELDEITEMSPFCIGVGSSLRNTSNNDTLVDSNRYPTRLESIGSLREIFNEIDDEREQHDSQNNDNDSNSSCWDDDSNSKEGQLNTELPETLPRIIIRGKTGPGRWHCYTAIIDSDRCILRVDGLTENETVTDEQLQVHQKKISQIFGALDGLTIGSDHSFEMPLCCGGVDVGEGEGAISEIAVFKGTMTKPDLETIEGYLMRKHGISSAVAPICDASTKEKICNKTISSWQEDEWNRDAHALIQQFPPYYDLGNKPVPLGALTKHRSVAWHRKNDVTGAQVRVSRIGSKFSTGSSSSLQ